MKNVQVRRRKKNLRDIEEETKRVREREREREREKEEAEEETDRKKKGWQESHSLKHVKGGGPTDHLLRTSS